MPNSNKCKRAVARNLRRFQAKKEQLTLEQLFEMVSDDKRVSLTFDRKSQSMKEMILVWMTSFIMFSDTVPKSTDMLLTIVQTIYMVFLGLACASFYIKNYKYADKAFNSVILLAQFRIVTSVWWSFTFVGEPWTHPFLFCQFLITYHLQATIY